MSEASRSLVLQAIADITPDAVYVKDRAGRLIFANKACMAVIGLDIADVYMRSEQDWHHHTAEAATIGDHDRSVIETGRTLVSEECFTTPDWTKRVFLSTKAALRDVDDQITGIIGISTDITTRKASEQALKESERRLQDTLQQLALALDIGEIGIWMYQPATGAFAPDERTRQLCLLPTGLKAGFADLLRLIHQADRDLFENAFKKAEVTVDTRPFDIECRVTAEGSREVRWIATRGKLVPEEGGGPPRFICTSRDVTARREREIQVSVLLRELSHRTKNTLAVVQAIARQMAATAPDIRVFRNRFDERLHAMSRSLDLLAEQNWRGVRLRDLAVAQLEEHSGRVRMQGPDILIKADSAQNLGLVLHELTANAVADGALSSDNGEVHLTWEVDEATADAGQVFKLSWRESGGPPVRPPTSGGLGRALTRRLAPGGRSDLQFLESGVVWEMSAPADQIIGSGE